MMTLKNKRLALLIALVIYSTPFFAQQSDSTKPVVLYNKHAFSSSGSGIKKLVQLYGMAENSHNSPRRSPIDPAKLDERQKTERLAAIQKDYEVRFETYVRPYLNIIEAELIKIENENNLLLLDGIELEEKGYLLGFDPKFDVTTQLISFFNVGGVRTLQTPKGKLGIINSKRLFDGKGTPLFLSSSQKDLDCKPEKCEALCLKLNDLAQRLGLVAIVDASRDLPEKLKLASQEDVTDRFLKENSRQ